MQIVLTQAKTAVSVLKLNSLNLMLPQSDIRSLESASDMDLAAPALSSVGWITYMQKRWPVYCLSDQLALMPHAPVDRRACVILAMGVGFMGIMCDDIVVLKEFSSQQYELPLAMRYPDTPLLHLEKYEQGIACFSNSYRLTSFVEKLVANVV